MTTMPDVITAPQAERHNRRRKGYPLPGSYWDRVQRCAFGFSPLHGFATISPA
jgi:hypothetical protein